MGSRYLISLSAENRKVAGITAGQTVEVDVALDTEPRQVALPDDFKLALDRDTSARRFFDTLNDSERQWFVMGIEDAKTAETRQRRIAKAVTRLSAGRGQRYGMPQPGRMQVRYER